MDTNRQTAMQPAPGSNRADETGEVTQPWWRYPIVWLVVGGPLTVVVAGVITAVIAVQGADTLVTEAALARQTAVHPTATTPALQARNHAATAAPRP